MVGGPGRNRTGIRGFAVRCITTLPPDPRWLRALCRAGRRAVKGGLAAFSHLRAPPWFSVSSVWRILPGGLTHGTAS